MNNYQISDFAFQTTITTRWMDNDMYGHVNNVNYYSYFDTVVNLLLIKKAGFDPLTSTQIGFIVKSNCDYIRPIAYPSVLTATVSVQRIGSSSVDYIAAIFDENQELCAKGYLTHVFVHRDTNKPCPISQQLRDALNKALIPPKEIE